MRQFSGGGGGGGVTLANDGNNRVTTAPGSDSLNGEANLTFDGSVLTISGAQLVNRVSKASADSPYSVAATDYYIGCTTDGAITINLPAVGTAGTGRVLIIKDEAGAGAGTNSITLDGASTETIDGSETQVISTDFASVTLVCNGTGWSIV